MITIFKDNLDSLIATLKSVSILCVNVNILLKNGGERLSEKQRDIIDSQFKSHNFKVTILELPDNGIYSAMNQALKYSISNGILKSINWVWFLNSGDRLEFASNSDLKELRFVPSSSLIICGDPSRGLDMEFNETRYIDAYKFLEGKIVIGHQVALFRPEVFLEFGLYDDKKKIVADYILMHKVISKYPLTKTKFPKINYEDGGISRVKLVTQEFEKIIYATHVFKQSLDNKVVTLVIYKSLMLIKYIFQRGLEGLFFKGRRGESTKLHSN
jgi:hypothetical protein